MIAGSCQSGSNPAPASLLQAGAALSVSNPLPNSIIYGGASVSLSNAFPTCLVIAILQGGSALSLSNPLPVGQVVGGANVSLTNSLPTCVVIGGACAATFPVVGGVAQGASSLGLNFLPDGCANPTTYTLPNNAVNIARCDSLGNRATTTQNAATFADTSTALAASATFSGSGHSVPVYLTSSSGSPYSYFGCRATGAFSAAGSYTLSVLDSADAAGPVATQVASTSGAGSVTVDLSVRLRSVGSYSCQVVNGTTAMTATSVASSFTVN